MIILLFSLLCGWGPKQIFSENPGGEKIWVRTNLMVLNDGYSFVTCKIFCRIISLKEFSIGGTFEMK